MTANGRSYWKTVAAASLVAGGSGALLVAATAWLASGQWGPGRWLAWGGITLLLAPAAGCAALVVGGGLIGLHRDALEARGVPYAPRKPREGVSGPVVSAVRRTLRRMREIVLGAGPRLGLRPGELIEVKSLPEILESLDERGTLDGLPFMPEMAAYCGKQFRVFRRVDKINDWVGHTGLRRPRDTVMLERLSCDGAHHGGCQANCQLRWKEAWLRRAGSGSGAGRGATAGASAGRSRPALAEVDLDRLAGQPDGSGTVRYVCQVTELAAGTTPLARNDPRHWLRDLAWGNVRPGPLLVGACIAMFNWVQRLRGGVASPNYTIPQQATSPHQTLDLQPREVVRVRTKREIEPTLNAQSRNRGLWFDAEMLRFCGGEYRVLTRVERLIEERTGKMLHLTSPCIILDGVAASGEYQGFCAQNESIFWREIWLERV